MLQSLDTLNPGALHNQPILHPYPKKERLQPKRSKAHLMGTTYVHDFPELFCQGVQTLWLEHLGGGISPLGTETGDLLVYKELILDTNNDLMEIEPSPGKSAEFWY